MINELKIIKLLEVINDRLIKLGNKDKNTGTRVNRATRPTIKLNGGIR